MIQIDSRIYDDIFLLAKILEKTELSKDEKTRVYKRFEKSTEIQEILNYLDTTLHPIISPDNWNVYSELHDMVSKLPSAQPERTCVNCGRTVNNGGWYADGRTRCPIEEHYALPKDGYCHLWEKRNVTDDDYPEGRADE